MILNGILSLAVYCNMIHIQSCYSVTAITNKYYAIKKKCTVFQYLWDVISLKGFFSSKLQHLELEITGTL